MIHLLFLLGRFDFGSGGDASGLLYQLAPLGDTIRNLSVLRKEAGQGKT